MIERADRWLLEKVFEPVAHFCERGFGLTVFTLARFCIILVPATEATEFWQQSDAWRLTVLLISIAIALVRLWAVSGLEGMTGANPEKHFWPMMYMRMFYSALVVFDAVFFALVGSQYLLIAIATFGFWSHLYFAASDRPPPIEEKSWAWRTREA